MYEKYQNLIECFYRATKFYFIFIFKVDTIHDPDE